MCYSIAKTRTSNRELAAQLLEIGKLLLNLESEYKDNSELKDFRERLTQLQKIRASSDFPSANSAESADSALKALNQIINITKSSVDALTASVPETVMQMNSKILEGIEQAFDNITLNQTMPLILIPSILQKINLTSFQDLLLRSLQQLQNTSALALNISGNLNTVPTAPSVPSSTSTFNFILGTAALTVAACVWGGVMFYNNRRVAPFFRSQNNEARGLQEAIHHLSFKLKEEQVSKFQAVISDQQRQIDRLSAEEKEHQSEITSLKGTIEHFNATIAKLNENLHQHKIKLDAIKLTVNEAQEILKQLQSLPDAPSELALHIKNRLSVILKKIEEATAGYTQLEMAVLSLPNDSAREEKNENVGALAQSSGVSNSQSLQLHAPQGASAFFNPKSEAKEIQLIPETPMSEAIGSLNVKAEDDSETFAV